MSTTRKKYILSKASATRANREARRRANSKYKKKDDSMPNKLTMSKQTKIEPTFHNCIYKRTQRPKSGMPDYVWGTYF